LFIFLFFIYHSNLLYANVGKYAILLFGGGYFSESGPSDDELYVQYEIAPMFETLVDPNKYGFQNDNIYVFNLSGNPQNPDDYYQYFNTAPENYLAATPSELISVFHDLNEELSYQEDNLLFIYMAGHEIGVPDPPLNFYRMYKLTIKDIDFANWILNDLLNRQGGYDVSDQTHLVFVTGFCSSFQFYDPELKNVCNFISYAAADIAEGMSTVQAGPRNSFMKFWNDQAASVIGNSISTIFSAARTDVVEYCYTAFGYLADDPAIDIKPGNDWHSSWNLFDGNLSPAAPQNLSVSASQNDHPLLTWDANDEADLKQYNIYKMNHESEFVLYDESTTNSYEDTEEEIGGSPFQHSVYYKVTALDLTLNESNLSNQAGISVDGMPPYSFGNTPNTDSIKHYLLPQQYSLLQNFPNPFNPITKITFDLPQDSNVEINIFTINGEKLFEIFKGYKTAGNHSVIFDGGKLSSGIYLYSIKAGSYRQVRKMMFIK